MNAHIESEIRELLGFLGCNNPKMAGIAIKAAAGFEHPDGAEALLLIGLASENPQISCMAALELLKKGKICIDEMDFICMLAPAKRKTEVILKASKLENKPLAAALLSCWLADKDSGISNLAKKKLAELGEPAKEKEIPASKPPCGALCAKALEVVFIDRDAVKKAFPGRATAYEKIRMKIKL